MESGRERVLKAAIPAAQAKRQLIAHWRSFVSLRPNWHEALGWPDETIPANTVVSERKSAKEATVFVGFED